MKRALLLVAAGWVAVCGLLAALVVGVADTPASSAGGGLAVLAAYNAKEGQGDLLCGPVGPAGAGAQVAALAAARAGFTGPDLLVAVAVAGAESGWNPNATHLNADGSTDYGMWQINSVHALLLSSGDWADPYSNAEMAKRIHDDAGGWTPWSTYTSGAYLSRMGQAQAAVGGQAAAPAAPCVGSGAAPGGPDHLTPWTRAMRSDISAQFPGLTVGCYRSIQDGGEHPLGRACDFMVYADSAKGDAIAAYAQANAARLHIMYVIWQQHIWSPARASEGWRLMEDRGSPTANHMDHVHVSVLP